MITYTNYPKAINLRIDCIPVASHTVGTKIIADPEKCFQELISDKLLILLWDRPCLELIIVSSNFQAFLFLQKNYWNQSESY